MTPKTIFDKETIIEAAFEIAKKEGISSLTTRKVAKQLGSSVAPIYVNFETVEDLIDAVFKKVMDISGKLLQNQTGSDSFQRIGRASIAFAREYPVLFRELALHPNKLMASYESLEEQLLATMAEDKSMRDLDPNEQRVLLFKMRAFQIGLSVMLANGQIPSWLTEKGTEELLMQTGEDLLTALTVKKRVTA